MRIGLDFNGVIANCVLMKQKYAKILFNVDLAPEYCVHDMAIRAGLNEQQYAQLKKSIYETEHGLDTALVPGAVEGVANLLSKNHELRIVTMRWPVSFEIAKIWLRSKGIDLPIQTTNGSSNKRELTKGLDVFIDDDIDKLNMLTATVPNLFLMSWPHNKDVEIRYSNIKRVEGWMEFCNEVEKLNAQQAAVAAPMV